MRCFYCNTHVEGEKVCPSCGRDLQLLSKARQLSLSYYNRGLKRAQVRDLSGAVLDLRASLEYDKENTDARNLLGLVYFETGEIVDALSEWVISKNFQPDNNIADKYLELIQNNQSKLDTISQTIKKYNQALLYCQQDSPDLAIIQLKKVLSINPNLIKAHQLLGLLYIQENRFDKAIRTLKKAQKIDKTHPLTLRYFNEAENALGVSGSKKPEGKKEPKTFLEANGERIRRTGLFGENSGLQTIVNIIIGLVIGVCLTWFLVVPGIKKSYSSSTSGALKEANETIASKNSEIAKLTKELETANDNSASLQTQLNNNDSASAGYARLFEAYTAEKGNDYIAAEDALLKINPDLLSDEAKAYYTEMKSKVDTKAIEEYYANGSSNYESGKYKEAITDLEKVVALDEGYKDGYAIYYLGMSYKSDNNADKAKEIFAKAKEKFPEGNIATMVDAALKDMK